MSGKLEEVIDDVSYLVQLLFLGKTSRKEILEYIEFCKPFFTYDPRLLEQLNNFQADIEDLLQSLKF